jgi:hypothetical protein
MNSTRGVLHRSILDFCTFPAGSIVRELEAVKDLPGAFGKSERKSLFSG